MQRLEFNEDAKGPLDGLRVLDLSRLVAGNMLSLQLADFGAEVIKVEDPAKGDPLRAWREGGYETYWKVYGRNKHSLTLNLRDDTAKDILLQLVESSAILIENYRPGVLEKMDLAPAVLLARNPGLVIVRISGFGQTGPYRERPGFGTLVESLSGFAARNGYADRGPLLPPLALADMIAGLQGAYAVMVALRQVELKGGAGQVIDLSLLEPILSTVGPEALSLQVNGTIKPRAGNASNNSAPRNVYMTRDDKHVALSASIQTMAERVFRTIGRDDMNDDPRFRTNPDRVKHRDEVDAALGGWIAERDQVDVLRIFNEAGITASAIYDPRDMIDDPHFNERGVIVELPDDELGTVPMHNVNARFSGTPGGFRLPAPKLGQHTDALLDEIGIAAESRADLRRRGVI